MFLFRGAMQKLLFVSIFSLATLMFSQSIYAKKKTPAPKIPSVTKKVQKENVEPDEELKKALAGLNSLDPDEVIESIQIIGASANPLATTPLIDLLKTGPRSDITDSILFALGSIINDDAVPIIIDYTKHRRPDTRIAALLALENKKSDDVTRAAERGLRDSDRQVRATAAAVLGTRRDSASIPILFAAFERDVSEAAIAIGKTGNEDDSKRLLGYLGKKDIKVLLAGFEEFLKRDSFAESAKLNILNRLFDLAGPEVWRFAVNLKATFPPEATEENNNVLKLVNRMVRQIKDK